jgi:hypothetical protein
VSPSHCGPPSTHVSCLEVSSLTEIEGFLDTHPSLGGLSPFEIFQRASGQLPLGRVEDVIFNPKAWDAVQAALEDAERVFNLPRYHTHIPGDSYRSRPHKKPRNRNSLITDTESSDDSSYVPLSILDTYVTHLEFSSPQQISFFFKSNPCVGGFTPKQLSDWAGGIAPEEIAGRCAIIVPLLDETDRSHRDEDRVSTIQDFALQASLQLHDWTSKLNMPMVLHFDGVIQPELKEVDIFEFVGVTSSTGVRAYFPSEYCSDHGFNSSGDWSNLKKLIRREAIKNGYSLHSDGWVNGSNTSRRISCTCGKVYRPNKKKIEGDIQRKSSNKNDKKNSRGIAGKKMSRRSSTRRPMDKGKLCPVRFNISYDDIGFYIRTGDGNSNHKFHPSLSACSINVPTELLTQDDVAHVQIAREAAVTVAHLRTPFWEPTLFMAKCKVKYATNIPYVDSHFCLFMDNFP